MNGKRSMILKSGLLAGCSSLLIGLSSLLAGCGGEDTMAQSGVAETENVGNVSDTSDNADHDSDNLSGSSTETQEGSSAKEVYPDGKAVEAGLAAPVSKEEACRIIGESYDGPEINLVMVGDILLHTPVAESGLLENGNYDFEALFSNVEEEIGSADFALVNQEVIIGGKELGISGYPSFNAPYELGDALKEAGFDGVLHATNHALDQGKSGVKNCLNFWSSRYPDMAVLGINASQNAQDEIFVYEQDGIRIALLNYTYGTNGIALPQDMPYAVNLLEEERVKEDILKAEELADFTVVLPHWGIEYSTKISDEQEYWTNIFLEGGVDLVIGTHPHVIGPIEWVSDKQGNEMLVYYSLGNFVNWTASSGEGIADRMVGGMAQVRIGRDEDGEAFIVDYGIEPLVSHLEGGPEGVTTYLLKDYTEELAERNEIKKQDPAFSLKYCKELSDEVWQRN